MILSIIQTYKMDHGHRTYMCILLVFWGAFSSRRMSWCLIEVTVEMDRILGGETYIKMRWCHFEVLITCGFLVILFEFLLTILARNNCIMIHES